MTSFVWTKMEAEGGQTLDAILKIKEAERIAGAGIFWWGIGNSLGPLLQTVATDNGGTLPVLFSKMLTPARLRDSKPDQVCIWTQWQDPSGNLHEIPPHVLSWSRAHDGKKSHYALVCRSPEGLSLVGHGPFDPARCLTVNGKKPGASQVTALLEGDLSADHSPGVYHWGFRATLVAPWLVKLASPKLLSVEDRQLQASWRPGANWMDFVSSIRQSVTATL